MSDFKIVRTICPIIIRVDRSCGESDRTMSDDRPLFRALPPTSDKYAIRSNEFSLSSHLRLGLALSFTNFINECDCGKELDKNGYHLLTCKYGGGPVWFHNCIVDAYGWTECLSDLHIPYQVEPRHHYTNTDDRPDTTIFDIETGQTLDLDISLAHPWSVDNVKRASRIDGFAASAREDKKKAKYSEHQLPGRG